MRKTYNIIEKTISIVLIVSGIFILWLSLDLLLDKLDIVVRSNDNSYSGLSHYYYGYFRDFHLVVIFALLSIISGILLLKSKKNGWLLSAIVFIGFPISILLRNWLNPESDFHNPGNSTVIAIGTTILLLLVGVLHFAKPFKKKYNVNSKDILFILLGLGIIIVDIYVFKK
ncbi:hypothetical protein [Formosa sp. L2A11]|uniref:hypothetical protein n=1 Tax=Formosa sp. L2A11 TaxID=2686363 RepID=UPI00131D4B63|nr:hypothetical protein [Formosa sp. L2A11]